MIIFDDGRGQLGPMTDLRASFEVRTGMLTTAGRIVAPRPEALAGYWVPGRLAELVGQRCGTPINELPDARSVLCVNGRWRSPDRRLKLRPGHALVESGSDDVVIALLSREQATALLEGGTLPDGVEAQSCEEGTLYRFPWDVLGSVTETICGDLDAVRMVETKVPSSLANMVGHHPVEVHRTARIYPGVVLDAERGPIAIHENAVIRPNAVLCGPCAIDHDSVVIDHALVKPNTVIGPFCKIAGEVGGTIFQGFSNKAHEGHLGDSWVGKWVNFGAGTTNSNLLNTYGEVMMRLEPEGPMHRTGLTFQGAIVGDHVKFAINTRLMTGSVFGTGAMIATTAAPPTTVRRFAWLTDRGEQLFRFEKFLDTASRMMVRRDKVPNRAYIAVLQALHDEARAARDAALGR